MLARSVQDAQSGEATEHDTLVGTWWTRPAQWSSAGCGTHDWQKIEPFADPEPLLLQVCDAAASQQLPITGVPTH